jgi:DnaJ-domain-containing protein 1
MRFGVGAAEMLRQYARCLPGSFVFGRFKSMDETFSRSSAENDADCLMEHERRLLETIGDGSLSLREVIDKCGLPENSAIRSMYDLWVGGEVLRMNWNAAIPPQKLLAIRDAKVSKVRSAAVNSAYVASPEPPQPAEQPKVEATELTVEQYLERIDKALTHYETLGVDVKADGAKIKQMYFRLAKQFHPDRFHRSEPELAARVQKAFSNIAHAYETLKSPDLRENYDFKMRKELEKIETRRAAGLADLPDDAEQKDIAARESFQAGFDLLAEEDHAAAIPHLARAVHIDPDNAQYHAYYGQALTIDPNSKHKAESEMQTAIKMEPENIEFRIMLIEFFIEMDLLKRAEGELVRMLAIKPDHQEAKEMLRQIRELTQR